MKYLVILISLLVLSAAGILMAKNHSPQPKPPLRVEEDARRSEDIIETFIVMGDSGTGVQAQYDVANQVKAFCDTNQKCKAVFIPGDVIYDTGVNHVTDPQFKTKFEQPYANIDMPFYIAFGNHDYLGCVQCYIDYAALSHKWKMPSRYYVQEFKTAKFIVIDTEKFDTLQQQWLKKHLDQETDKHEVVVGHRPVLTDEVEKHTENWAGKKELTEIICNQADMYLSGHSHILEDPGPLPNCTVKLLISGTAGSYPRNAIFTADSPFHASINGFLTLNLSSNFIQYAFIDFLGNTLHQNGHTLTN